MGILDFFKSKEKVVESESVGIPKIQQDIWLGRGDYNYNPIIDTYWDGEKTPGELGAVENTTPDYLKLRLRAHDMNLKTDIVKIITGKFFKWVVGSGLKLQSEFDENVLKISGVNKDLSQMKSDIESLFNLYTNSNYSDYQEKDNFHEKASEAFKTSFLGGDCLCIIRFEDQGPTIQVIDGQQVENPFDEKDKEDGNVIRHGIEINKKGQHVAFWVKIDSEMSEEPIEFKRVKAKNSNGNLVAWMIYGNKHRIDHHRGIPVISSILEKIAKLDRYVEASVKKAEETANVVYAFEHSDKSTGENILTQSLTGKKVDGKSPESAFEQNGRTAAAMRQTTSGTVINLAPESKLASLSNPNETSFNEFFRAVFTALCAAVDIPEEVALQKYEQNYSSSRAAINGWEHIVEIYRIKFADKFYKPFYKAWFEYQVLTNKINCPEYINAKSKKDLMCLEAFYKSRFTGKKMPHIDPLKEAKAIRSMLGETTAPLISHEQAAEMLGAGDWGSNYKKYLEEDKLIPKPELDVKNENNGKKPAMESKPKA